MGHNHHHTPEMNNKQSGAAGVQPWEPRTKLVAGIIFVFGVISLNSLWLLGISLVFATIFALWGGLDAGQLLKKLAVLLPFLALMSIPLVLGGGVPPDPERSVLAAQIFMKALTAMTFTIFVFTNQPIEEMLEALEHLKVPAAITTVIYLAYRYGFLFIQEMETTLRALKARLFTPRLHWSALPIYGELAGGLLIKSINRSETVYRAMTARGFRGSVPVGKPRPIENRDLGKAAFPAGFLMVLIIIEQVVL